MGSPSAMGPQRVDEKVKETSQTGMGSPTATGPQRIDEQVKKTSPAAMGSSTAMESQHVEEKIEHTSPTALGSPTAMKPQWIHEKVEQTSPIALGPQRAYEDAVQEVIGADSFQKVIDELQGKHEATRPPKKHSKTRTSKVEEQEPEEPERHWPLAPFEYVEFQKLQYVELFNGTATLVKGFKGINFNAEPYDIRDDPHKQNVNTNAGFITAISETVTIATKRTWTLWYTVLYMGINQHGNESEVWKKSIGANTLWVSSTDKCSGQLIGFDDSIEYLRRLGVASWTANIQRPMFFS